MRVGEVVRLSRVSQIVIGAKPYSMNALSPTAAAIEVSMTMPPIVETECTDEPELKGVRLEVALSGGRPWRVECVTARVRMVVMVVEAVATTGWPSVIIDTG